MNNGQQLGKIAELYAQQFFVRKGYQLLAKNYRYRKAEVDLIVRQKTATPLFGNGSVCTNHFRNGGVPFRHTLHLQIQQPIAGGSPRKCVLLYALIVVFVTKSYVCYICIKI